ncbi:Propanediol utilization protein [Dethiosulfatibacter aminovorans DSM 17477]|uniref:Phosphate propanoyltransferase n=1 Tax=Dethiosulfatibacter aminovorans DSM 17477 TaxID=1121476 RepID=A0A1M6DQ54_9FIRM|nr:phosphate propanoyltransferase [Dethiosulfatibacter aminovorans]SHI75376.1 Propanediol utilization protein [Dethiosulfatibacter aminovorans DSM 17477]
MNNYEIKDIVEKILNEISNKRVERKSKLVPVEASARHVHLSRNDVEALFGKGAKLTKRRDLSQPGEFLSEQRIKLITDKGIIENVAVLGPERDATQVEISMTDARTLGLNAPVNLSGNLNNASSAYLVGNNGMVEAVNSVIVAKCHIHMSVGDARAFGLVNGQRVRVRIAGQRPMTFDDVVVRVNPDFTLAMHIDYDEANACALEKNNYGTILDLNEMNCELEVENSDINCLEKQEDKKPMDIGKLITESKATDLIKCKGENIDVPAGTIITPSAKDIFSRNNKILNFV